MGFIKTWKEIEVLRKENEDCMERIADLEETVENLNILAENLRKQNRYKESVIWRLRHESANQV